jgi:hypothetical protein
MAGFSEASLVAKALQILVDEEGFDPAILVYVPKDKDGVDITPFNPLASVVKACMKATYRELTNGSYDNPCQASDQA